MPAPHIAPPEQRPVASLRGVGPALAEKLGKLGVTQVQDLLFVLPSRYEDRTQISAIGEVRVSRVALVFEGEHRETLGAGSLGRSMNAGPRQDAAEHQQRDGGDGDESSRNASPRG